MHDKLPSELAVLTVAETYAADQAAMRLRIHSLTLMEAAGAAVTAVITSGWSRQHVTVLCGPGNNGGDGYVVARLLHDAGWPVQVARYEGQLAADAAVNADRWHHTGGTVVPFGPAALDGASLVVDALFGAGLKGPLDADVLTVLALIRTRNLPCIAVDLPSGIDGESGEILGGEPNGAVQCAATVTFFRAKPAHLLYPGRAYCGALTVADIGVPARVLQEIRPLTVKNTPLLWTLPRPGWADHKYTRGYALIVGGAHMTGAARLAARAARRVGAGLLALAVPETVVPIYATSEPGCFVEPRGEGDVAGALADPRRNGVLIGPGCGIGEGTRAMVRQILATDRPVVLDADALTSFAAAPDELFAMTRAHRGPCVLTPHPGEFARLFGPTEGGKLRSARAAAVRSGATVVFKGPDTVVATPDGLAAVASNAPAWLATGGSGDVLAGLILGLLVQGSDAWTAATAGVWLQGAAATHLGRGLVAEDLPEAIPRVLSSL